MLEQFTRDDVAGYHSSRYVPSRTIVTLVGDLDEEVALAALRAQWGEWRRPAVPIPDGPAETGAATVQVRRLQGDVALAEVVLGWRAPGVLDAEIPALDLASAILGVGRASRFGKSLRESGLVNGVGVSTYGVTDAGIFSIGLELNPERIPAALAVIGRTLQDLAMHAPDAQEFDRALTMLRAGIRRRLERFESRATSLADAEAHGDVTRLDREESDLLAVTPAMVRDAVQRWLVPDGVSAVGYLPRQSEVEFDEGMLRAGINSRRPERSEGLPESTRHEARKPFAALRATPSHVSRVTSHASIHHVALDHTDILTARFGETGQTSLGIYRRRIQVENAVNAGLSALAVRTMVRGTERYDAAGLAFAMESLGGSLTQILSSDLIGFGTTVLRDHARSAAELLAEVLHRPRFAAESVEIERAILLEDARAVADDMMRFPMQLMLGVAFGDAGYGSPTLGTEQSVAAINETELRRWHAGLLDGGRTTIVAVGDADPERLAEEIAEVVISTDVIPSEAR
ncbi:MAG: insulinase family protein, partial [Gemmatimonadota bacterium]